MKPAKDLVPAESRALAVRQASWLALVGDRLVVPSDPDRETVDGYLRLTAHILLEAERRPFRTIGIVGPRADDGRSSAALNLAMCLGRTRGRKGRVLLVDADGRRRALTRLLCAGTKAEVVESRDEPFLVSTDFEGLDLLTAPPSRNGPSVQAPAAWIETLRRLGARYPQIVIDCPPVLDDPDGLVLRECVEEIVLVLRRGRTPRRELERTVGSVRRRVLGVILHDDGRSDVA